jgi:hypothetical protein
VTVFYSGGPLDGTEFPIFDNEPSFFGKSQTGVPGKRSGLYRIRGLSAKAQKVVTDLQPFQLRKTMSPGNEPVLALLHNLNVIDKHRRIRLCRWRTTEGSIHVLRDVIPTNDWALPMGEVKDGFVFAEWTSTIADDEPDLEIKLGFEVALSETAENLEGKGVIRVLDALIAGVERAIFHYLTRAL